MLMNRIFDLIKLRRNLTLQSAELEAIQRKKLKDLINHAYDNVPYYRRLFDSVNIKPEDIKEVKDLVALPITDKSVMRSMEKSEIMARNIEPEKCVEIFTSGSTGMPAHIYFSKEDYELLDLVYLRSFLENGLKYRHRRAFVLDPHSFDTKKRWYHRMGLATYTNISCFLSPQEQVQILKITRPDFIHGYPSSLSQIARLMLDSRTNGIRPSIVSTAAELLHRKDRELIAMAFGVDPYDRYAARECGNIAWECDEHHGYHMNIDTLVVEFIKDGRPVEPGQRGDVVVTNLHSYAMPFIRYRIGDVGVPSDKACKCGMELPMMEIIEGRDEDFIVLRGGRSVSPMIVTGTLDHIPGIKQFRVIQEDLCSLAAVVAKGKNFGPDTVDRVGRELKGILGENIDIRCQAVEDIPRDPSGKVRAVISRLRCA